MSSNDDRDNLEKGLEGDRAIANNQSQNEWLNLEIYVRNNQTELLVGLDQWIQLNLISQAQVKKLCRNNLSCKLPEVEIIEVADPQPSRIDNAIAEIAPKPVAVPNILTQVFQGFLEELSIRWLLFLGIFLVVISSGVLAASQWQNFPIFGQYLILLIYTLGFWLSGFWTSKHHDLRLTSQTLTAIATLLIPINFWAISHLGLGNDSLEWLIVAVAAIILTITVWLSRLRAIRGIYYLPLYLILSYLHLGWQIPLLPLVAVYGGVILISSINYWLLLSEKHSRVNLSFVLAAWSLLLLRGLITTRYSIADYCLAIAIFAWLMATMGLASATGNKIIPSTAEITNDLRNQLAQIFSLILFVATWLTTILSGITGSTLFFWQTTAINGLAIHCLTQRLTLYWRKQDLTAIFLIGLQTLYVAKELIPDGWRREALDLSVNLSKTEYFPESVFGVTLFPYVILFVAIASWLYRREKSQLALYGEYLTLLLGIFLTCLSLANPTWRSLNLLLSTLTLAYVAQIRRRSSLIYLTHLLGLTTIVNGIDFFFPSLTKPAWGSILVLLMTLEWLIHLRQRKQGLDFNYLALFAQSSWYFGLFLSAASYSCFFAQNNPWGLVWLVTPVMLTLIARSTSRIKQRRLVTVLSCIALLVAQLLILGTWETRFIGLAIAVGLMGVNAFNLRRTLVAVIHLGFVLSLFATVFSSFVGNELVSNWYWLLIGGASILGLYQLRLYLLKTINVPKFGYISQRTAHGILGVGVESKNFKLVNKYIQAADYWAIALISVELGIISFVYPFLSVLEVGWQSSYILFTTVLLASAVLWRHRLQPTNLVLFTLTWLGSLFAVALTAIFARSSLIFAITNLVLGLLSLVVIERMARPNSAWKNLSLSYVPLIYAGLGILWRLSDFNAYTGLLTLGVAIILLNTRHRDRRVSGITSYLGFAGLSLGIYELVIYQMQSSSEGSAADALTILSLVAAAIAFIYRVGAYSIASTGGTPLWVQQFAQRGEPPQRNCFTATASRAAWLCRQQQKGTLFNLSLAKVVLVAHTHWAISSVLKIMAAGIAIETANPDLHLKLISIATSLCLGAYAVIQGKDRRSDLPQSNDWWVYVGLVEIAATLVYSRLIISRLSLFDPWRVIFTCAIALLIYQIPWKNLGWNTTPWQRTALILPALMALITAEDISYLGLLITALFYLRVAYGQKNIRWSYLSLGLIDWGIVRLVWQDNYEFIWLAGIISLSVLYVAQFDPQIKTDYTQRHRWRLFGSSIICIVALFYQPGIVPSAIACGLIFVGLGLKIRAFLFAGTITLILTAIYQLVILVLAYSFLKWVVGLLAGICSIAIAAGFEKQRDQAISQLKNYSDKLQNWQ
jgi:hypothetical protein